MGRTVPTPKGAVSDVEPGEEQKLSYVDGVGGRDREGGLCISALRRYSPIGRATFPTHGHGSINWLSYFVGFSLGLALTTFEGLFASGP